MPDAGYYALTTSGRIQYDYKQTDRQAHPAPLLGLIPIPTSDASIPTLAKLSRTLTILSRCGWVSSTTISGPITLPTTNSVTFVGVTGCFTCSNSKMRQSRCLVGVLSTSNKTSSLGSSGSFRSVAILFNRRLALCGPSQAHIADRNRSCSTE